MTRRSVLGWATCWSIVYVAVGAWLAFRVDLHVLDSMSRAAHAFFVWHNDPAKLANVGFAWPPLLTLPLLSMTWYEPLGRTGFAPVVVSAVLAAATVAFVRWYLARFDAPRRSATAVAMLIAVNPMFAWTAVNGMSEAYAVLLPSVAFGASMLHLRTRSTVSLAVAALAGMAAVMSRYELGVVVLLVLAAGLVAIPRSERSLTRMVAVTLFVAAPTAYATMLWIFFNWTVQGSPFWFLTEGNQIGTVTGTAATVDLATVELGAQAAIGTILLSQLVFAPLAIAMVVAMLVHAVRHRAARGAMLVGIAFLTYNLVTNVVLSGASGNAWFAQLRFNMRAIPLGAIALAWLLAVTRDARSERDPDRRFERRAWQGAVAITAISLVASGVTMARIDQRYLFGERAFLAAIVDPDIAGTVVGGMRVGCDSSRSMATWIERNVDGTDRILADDSSMYAVMMFSGRPERFLDTVDHGWATFLHNVDAPGAGVDYVLSTDFSECSGVGFDLVSERNPDLHERGELRAIGALQVAHREPGLTLWRIPPHTALPDSTPIDD